MIYLWKMERVEEGLLRVGGWESMKTYIGNAKRCRGHTSFPLESPQRVEEQWEDSVKGRLPPEDSTSGPAV